MTQFQDVCAFDEVPDGKAKLIQIDGLLIGVFNSGGILHAIDDLCPHMGASLSAGYFDGESVSCPWHAWRFNVCDGAWCDNPRLKLKTYPVKEKDGRVWLCTEPNEDPEEAKEKPDGEPNKEEPKSSD